MVELSIVERVGLVFFFVPVQDLSSYISINIYMLNLDHFSKQTLSKSKA